MNYKVVMLDFDGTLARTIPAILHASEKMLNMHGYEIDPVQVERNFGLALPEAFRCFANDDSIDDKTMEQMVMEYNTIYRNECEPLIELFDGVADTLATLKRAGVTLLIASNNIREVLERLTTQLDIAQYFDGIICADDVVNAKPAPDIALLALERYNIKGSEVLVVGDSTYDMDMGREAGCDLCGVSFGSHTPKMLREKGAKYIIDNFLELPKIVLG
ncbi:MAG: HAD family hydrolase [Alistipes sp.]|nr:HAD family hydrolase [Alistipes sp.]